MSNIQGGQTSGGATGVSCASAVGGFAAAASYGAAIVALGPFAAVGFFALVGVATIGCMSGFLPSPSN